MGFLQIDIMTATVKFMVMRMICPVATVVSWFLVLLSLSTDGTLHTAIDHVITLLEMESLVWFLMVNSRLHAHFVFKSRFESVYAPERGGWCDEQ